VVEEAPSPAVDDKLRLAMGTAAVAAAKAVSYVGAGTVEFLLARDKQFYFLEMNTRLQVEHPVTELVYGVDLVEWQLRVAQGEKLPLSQSGILARRNGWAIEVRLCAEDVTQNYLPQAGTVERWRAPTGSGVRVDTYLRDGQVISPYYDSMQAKIIAWGEDRDVARARLVKALEDTVMLGVTSNRDYLLAALRTDAFASGDFSTAFVGRYFPQDALAKQRPSPRQVALAAVALYLDDAQRLAATHALPTEFIGWHSSHEAPADFKLMWRDQTFDLEVMVHDGHLFSTVVGGEKVEIDVTRVADGEFHYVAGGVQGRASMAHGAGTVWLSAEGVTLSFGDLTLAPAEAAAAGADGRVLASSDGRIVAVHVKPGDAVKKGQTVVVLEAMKMEFQLTASIDGKVASVAVAAGAQVKNRQLLVQVTPA
jgi:geranyl-CoA carboxylase alpha subunit